MGDELEYKHADSIFKKERFQEFLAEDLIPTLRMNYILVGIFAIVIFFGLIQFPLRSFVVGNVGGLKIQAGYPLVFFDLQLDRGFENPFKVLPLAFDLGIYLLFSYLIDILLTALSRAMFKSKEFDIKPGINIFKKKLDREVVEI